ncbi:Trimeric GatFAB AmidoTransferase(AdT) complex subunit [Coemansia sp. IMI 203386]|nr:Trimeric GatFAB AmidoTransferase(AdT) complex subunit [Coemansia sp. IMI 203386]
MSLSRIPRRLVHHRCCLTTHSNSPPTVDSALETISQKNPSLNAFVTSRVPAELAETAVADGPLKGWPVGIKANIATVSNSDTDVTSCGSHALQSYKSPFQATVVDSLERAGAVVMGKTNMDEFGMGSKNTYSIYGPARNPHTSEPQDKDSCQIYDRSPGGSSGGSAAAVASNMCRAALGSDTGGSVRLPAAWCGIVGLKPSYGRISRYGLVPYGSSLDTVGIMARSVQDVQQVFQAVSRPDTRDMTCMTESLRSRINMGSQSRPWAARLLSQNNIEAEKPLAGIRIGIPRECWVEELSASALDAWKQGAEKLSALGCEIVAVSLPHLPNALPAYYTLALAEASSNLARYDGVRYGLRKEPGNRGPKKLGASRKYAETRSQGLGAEVQRRILLGTYVMSDAACRHFYLPSQRIRRVIQTEFDSVFALPNALSSEAFEKTLLDWASGGRSAGVDALLFPTATDTAPPLLEGREENTAASYVNDVMTVPANLAGIPAISVPVGHKDRMAIGLQLAAQYGDDELLLQIARYLGA